MEIKMRQVRIRYSGDRMHRIISLTPRALGVLHDKPHLVIADACGFLVPWHEQRNSGKYTLDYDTIDAICQIMGASSEAEFGQMMTEVINQIHDPIGYFNAKNDIVCLESGSFERFVQDIHSHYQAFL